jgi:hypothetical protein
MIGFLEPGAISWRRETSANGGGARHDHSEGSTW